MSIATMNAPAPYAPPSATCPLEAARKLAPLIRASADDIEKNRELPQPLFEAIADAGLFLMGVPREIGGGEVDLPLHVLAVEEIGKADASTAWAVNQGATFGMFSAYMDRDAAREVWINTPRSVVSNSPAPTAKAVAVPGGFRVSGRQGFSTGCRHASWVAAHSQIIENGEVRQRNGKPEIRYCFVPKAEAQIIDTWHTRGMRGTGTNHFEVKDVFVPEARTVITGNEPRVSGGTRYCIRQTLAFAAGDGAIALGVARSCLDAFYDLAGAKAPRHLTGLLRDQAISQFTVGQAEASLRSGRAFLMEAIAEIWEEAKQTGAVSMDQRIHLRLAGTHAIRLAAQVVENVYTACGGSAINEGGLIQRQFQDIHVITQHMQGRLAYYEMVGRQKMGLSIDEGRL